MSGTPFRLATLVGLLLLPVTLLAEEPATIEPLLRAVDLNIGDTVTVQLCDGTTATVKLVRLDEDRDTLRSAVREARVQVEVNGQSTTLVAGNYRLPITVGGVQIDCAATKGLTQPKFNPWALDADARLRLWPAGSPWIQPGTFVYPLRQKWFANDTQMANEPVFVDGGELPNRPAIYYHNGLDFGGSEAQVEVIAATDGLVVARGTEVLAGAELPSTVEPRYDVLYLRDGRGWYYRYSHLHTIDNSVKLGERITLGQRLGLLGKEGSSGGWSHLHLEISALQPSGRYGTVEGYAFVWQTYHATHQSQLVAVARPHHFTWTKEPVLLDGRLSWSAAGPEHLARFEWALSDGTTASGSTVERRYERPGTYSEMLKITDDAGRVSYDFAVIQAVDREHPEQVPPTIHAVYWPTDVIRAGDEVTFKVRSFRIPREEGHETWDFGDGTPTVDVQSDGNADRMAKDGYAVTTHRYEKPGDYFVRVARTNQRGETATGRLFVHVQPAGPIRVVLVGASTVATYDKRPADRPTLTGWGQVLGELFTEPVSVINCAVSGSSSKSFIQKGRWKKALDQQGDYVLIQFGHNDCPGKGDRTTDPKGDYRDYLRQYIREARRAGTRPILVTPVARRTFSAEGKISTTLQPYADAMRQVAREESVPLVDLHALSVELFERLGDAGSADFSPNATDRTHFSERGAQAIAQLVAQGLREAEPTLGRYLK